jgi:hypothetical protein
MVLLLGRTMTLSDSMIGCSTARPNDRVDKSYFLQFLDRHFFLEYEQQNDCATYEIISPDIDITTKARDITTKSKRNPATHTQV